MVALNDIRPIVVKSHLTKIIERALLGKINESSRHLLANGPYQRGFKEGFSTLHNLAEVLHWVTRQKKCRAQRKYNLFLDLSKAFDTVDRSVLMDCLRRRCQNDLDRRLVELIERLHLH